MEITKRPRDSISETAFCTKEYRRQFLCIKTALHSLQLQQEGYRNKGVHTKAVKKLLHDFESVDIAFEALNREEIKHRPSEDEDFIPARRKPQRKKNLDEALGLAK